MDHPASSGASGQRVARSRARRSASTSGAVCGVNRRGMAAPYDPHDRRLNDKRYRFRMRIAFVGKGGSGKTTVAAVFSRHLAASGRRVVAVDDA